MELNYKKKNYRFRPFSLVFLNLPKALPPPEPTSFLGFAETSGLMAKLTTHNSTAGRHKRLNRDRPVIGRSVEIPGKALKLMSGNMTRTLDRRSHRICQTYRYVRRWFWQPRYPRLAPLDRWLCVPVFRQVCPCQHGSVYQMDGRVTPRLDVIRHMNLEL